eukprot:2763554-Karenia_brevis.AAC.1
MGRPRAGGSKPDGYRNRGMWIFGPRAADRLFAAAGARCDPRAISGSERHGRDRYCGGKTRSCLLYTSDAADDM